MRRFGMTTLTLVATGIFVSYVATGPFDAQRPTETSEAHSVIDSPEQLPATSPDVEQVPTLAPPQAENETTPNLAVVDLPDEPAAQTQVIFIPVEVEHIAAGPRPGDSR